MQKHGGRNLLNRRLDTKLGSKEHTDTELIKSESGFQAPLHGCYVQGFMQNSKVPSYNPLDMKQMKQYTKTLIRILGVSNFDNNTSKFHAANGRFLSLRFSMKFPCGEI